MIIIANRQNQITISNSIKGVLFIICRTHPGEPAEDNLPHLSHFQIFTLIMSLDPQKQSCEKSWPWSWTCFGNVLNFSFEGKNQAHIVPKAQFTLSVSIG